MKNTEALRRQHADLRQLAAEIAPLLEADRLRQDSTLVRLKLCTWIRKLRVHLALEDRSVYPRLRSSDASIAAKAAQHRRETQAMLDRLSRLTPLHVDLEFETGADADAFTQEATTLFERLSKSFEHEEKDFYALVDVMPSGTWTFDLSEAGHPGEKPKLDGEG